MGRLPQAGRPLTAGPRPTSDRGHPAGGLRAGGQAGGGQGGQLGTAGVQGTRDTHADHQVEEEGEN